MAWALVIQDRAVTMYIFQVVRLLSRPEGATWIAVLLSLVIFSIFVIRAYERRYPLRLPPGNRFLS
eukprot:682747-Amorphochlora_amoeboformis.AAC.1